MKGDSVYWDDLLMGAPSKVGSGKTAACWVGSLRVGSLRVGSWTVSDRPTDGSSKANAHRKDALLHHETFLRRRETFHRRHDRRRRLGHEALPHHTAKRYWLPDIENKC